MLPNVLLVVLDCTRARNVSLHGYDRDTTPFLREFSDTATTYTRAVAPAPKSLTSHVSMFTGLAVEQHEVTFRDTALAPGHTVWESLAADDGYETGAFSANTFLTKLDVGLKDCFDHVMSGSRLPYADALDPREYLRTDDSPAYVSFLRDAIKSDAPVRSLYNGAALLRGTGQRHRQGDRYVDAFLDWEADVDGPWAACLNLMDAHSPYLPPAESAQWSGPEERGLMNDVDNIVWEYQCGHRPAEQLVSLETLYDDAIRYADAQLARLYRTLKERGSADRTFVVVTADHGEGFGERSRLRPTSVVGHGESKVHDAVLHVPLVAKRPGQERGSTVRTPVSLSAFPEAVDRVIEGRAGAETFATDDPVVATAVGLQDADTDGAGRYCEDLSAYTGRAHAVYETEGDNVRKYATWRDETTAVEITPDGARRELSEMEAGERVDATFEGLEDAGVSEASRAAVDDATYEELKDLGYA